MKELDKTEKLILAYAEYKGDEGFTAQEMDFVLSANQQRDSLATLYYASEEGKFKRNPDGSVTWHFKEGLKGAAFIAALLDISRELLDDADSPLEEV